MSEGSQRGDIPNVCFAGGWFPLRWVLLPCWTPQLMNNHGNTNLRDWWCPRLWIFEQKFVGFDFPTHSQPVSLNARISPFHFQKSKGLWVQSKANVQPSRCWRKIWSDRFYLRFVAGFQLCLHFRLWTKVLTDQNWKGTRFVCENVFQSSTDTVLAVFGSVVY